jgi:threonine/homoserine/homoserine lactone efflux protein
MFDSRQILGFVAAVGVLVVVPGPNTMLILAQSLAGGRAAGLVTVLGVEAGTVVHTLAAAFGLSAIVSTSAVAFEAVKFAGACYLAYAGTRALLQADPPRAAAKPSEPNLSRAFTRAVLTNVLNPKAAIFFLAFVPQFTHPERGHMALQMVALGAIVSGVGLSFGCLLALAAVRVGAWMGDTAIGRWQHRLMGSVLVALGLRLALLQRD